MTRRMALSKEYRAAVSGLAFRERSDRRLLLVVGKAPGEMLKGILTCRLPSGTSRSSESEVAYSAILTPKGKMVSDLRVLRSPEGGFLLDLPAAGVEATLAHLTKYLPPRLARVMDVSRENALVSLVGPRGPEVLGKLGVGAAGPESSIASMVELDEDWEILLHPTRFGRLRILRNGDVGAPAWDLLVAASHAEDLEEALLAEGANRLSHEMMETLRIEKGRPAFGVDMDGDTIPVEAGIHLRAIDYTKGCYVGQEVIVRIRDRGQVNKHLRGLLLGDAPVPAKGDQVFRAGEMKAVGRITSACRSPGFHQTLALGYVNRRVEPGAEVRVGSPDGALAQVRDLEADPWAPPA